MNKRYRKRIMADINIVPYIDVMLVLLVIFMVTAPLLNQGVEVDLPQADAEPLASDENRTLVLEIDREGNYFLHLAGDPAEAMSNDQILARTAATLQRNPATPVLVRADENINYGRVIQAMVLLQKGGAPKVGLSTELPEAVE
jgi:biopolymer transport protein TolR